MNRNGHYLQCSEGECSTEIKINNPVVLHLFFVGIVFYKYSLTVFDKNYKIVCGCADVPAWVGISKRKGHWWIFDFYEEI